MILGDDADLILMALTSYKVRSEGGSGGASQVAWDDAKPGLPWDDTYRRESSTESYVPREEGLAWIPGHESHEGRGRLYGWARVAQSASFGSSAVLPAVRVPSPPRTNPLVVLGWARHLVSRFYTPSPEPRRPALLLATVSTSTRLRPLVPSSASSWVYIHVLWVG